MSSSTLVSAAAATAPAKYIPVHRRRPASIDTTTRRSPSPTPSDASSATLVSTESPSTKPRVYSIETLLHLAHDPVIKSISAAQKDMLKQTAEEIVMSRKMRKTLEYHAMRNKALTQQQRTQSAHASPPHTHPIPNPHVKLARQRQRSNSPTWRKTEATLPVRDWLMRVPSVAAV